MIDCRHEKTKWPMKAPMRDFKLGQVCYFKPGWLIL